MSHVSDFTQSEDKIILDLINFDNGSNLTLDQVSIGSAVAGVGQVTTLEVTSIEGSGYEGDQTVTYNRLSIADFLVAVTGSSSITLQQGDAENVSDFLAEINTALATNLQLTDIVDEAIPEGTGLPNEELEADLVIAATSKVYTGSFTITIDGNDIPLSNVITTRVLNGLNLPVVDAGEPEPEPEVPPSVDDAPLTDPVKRAQLFSHSGLRMDFDGITNLILQNEGEVGDDQSIGINLGYGRFSITEFEGVRSVTVNYATDASDSHADILNNRHIWLAVTNTETQETFEGYADAAARTEDAVVYYEFYLDLPDTNTLIAQGQYRVVAFRAAERFVEGPQSVNDAPYQDAEMSDTISLFSTFTISAGTATEGETGVLQSTNSAAGVPALPGVTASSLRVGTIAGVRYATLTLTATSTETATVEALDRRHVWLRVTNADNYFTLGDYAESVSKAEDAGVTTFVYRIALPAVGNFGAAGNYRAELHKAIPAA